MSTPYGLTEQPLTLLALLQERAALAPHEHAYRFLTDGENVSESMTYAELNEKAQAIAAWLQSHGAAGERALLLYPPGLDYIAAFFGCLYAGVIAVPAYPPQRKRGLPRVQSIALDSQAAFLLTTTAVQKTIERLAESEGDTYANLIRLRWLTTDPLPVGMERGWHEPDIHADTLAFLQYTSGSTGLPKGVMISHGNLLHNEQMIQHAFGHTQDELIVGWLPLYHDMGLIGNVLQPLYLGVPCVLMSPIHFLQKPIRWLSAITRFRATTSGGPNFAYDLCTRQITETQRASLDLSSWTVAFNGAEPIRPGTLERFADTFASCGFTRRAFYPCYGLAEATLLVTGGDPVAEPVTGSVDPSVPDSSADNASSSTPSEQSRALVGCGTSRLNQQVRIIYPDSRTHCADRQVGEVWVMGQSVAQGYWQRREETDETFHASTADTNEGPFLRTGDLGFLAGTELFLTGRLKDLIIIRGRNHYPQDIEQTVEESHSSLKIGGGAAFSVPGQDEEQLVVVQEVEARAKHLDFLAVVETVRQRVAEQHEIQLSTVVLIKAGTLSRTSSGKVQRRLCRDKFLARELSVIAESIASIPLSLDPVGPEVDVAEAAPGSVPQELEQGISALWARVLERPSVTVHDDFFALGGDSLKGMQVLGAIQEQYHIEVPLETLFDHPTLGAFLAYLHTAPPVESSVPTASADVAVRETPAPLSPAQERFWFLEQLSQGSAINHVPAALRLRGALHEEALSLALNEIIRRHDVLRSRFVLEQGRPVQVTESFVNCPLSVHDLLPIPENRREAELRRFINEDAHRPFDLNMGPLVRARLFRMNDNDHVLSLTCHHIVTDGWSMGIFKRELSILYQAFKEGKNSPLLPLPYQYSDVACSSQSAATEAEFQKQITYWRSRLEQVPPVLTLPNDYPRPDLQGHRGSRHGWTLSADLVDRLKAVGIEQRTTLFMTLLSAFTLLLSRYSTQTDVCVGTPVANRHQRQSENLIGCFVNTVALRADLSGNPTLSELFTRVRTTVLEAHAHQTLPFERMIDELGIAKNLGHTPLFQVMFVLEDTVSDIRRLADLEASRMELSTGTSVFDLTLEMAQRADGTIAAWFEYSTDLFASSTIARMANHFQELLQRMVTSPDLPVSELGMLPPGERQSVLMDCNQTQHPYPETSCLHELFEAQVRKTPNALALIDEGEEYTYATLNAHANRCARLLQQEGIGPETTVGLCLNRSLDMAVGMLGCLKAGATYVPIDPQYPDERKTTILQDAKPGLILTHSSLLGLVPQQPARVISLNNHREKTADSFDENLLSCTHPDNAAYLLYTSGTTGRPKGTAVTHRALVNHATAMVLQYELTPTDRVLQFASVSFDVAVEECFPTWLAGGTVVLRPNEPVSAFSDFHVFIDAHRLTVLNLPTPYWSGWAEEIEQARLAMPPSLRLVIVGSEKALPDDLRRWQRIGGDTVGWCNSYGPTEATITASVYVPDANVDWSGMRTVPIGRPITNVELYVLDGHLQPVPVGVTGDLYIGGLGLARGYHHLPVLTADLFIPHPFAERSGARLYRTGDRVRRRGDGNLEFWGRSDDQIKIRGFRVELADIESHLRQHPQVKEARVFLEWGSPADWTSNLNRLSDRDQDALLKEIEAIPATEAQWLFDMESDAEERRKTVIQRKPEFDVYLKINKGEFLTPPKANQRNWLLRRALDEFSDDLLALDDLAKRFVSGSDRVSIEEGWAESQAEYTSSELIIEGQQVMQDWEAPLMKVMARIATESQGDVLEVGFGMGISATYIQEGRPRSHSIIECNREVMKVFADWRQRFPDRDIRLVEGRWQDVVDNIGPFDGVFFDTYPASEAEFEESVINSINFAEAFIPAAAKVLRPGGCFTYYTNEIDSFSRRHQRFLLKHFSSFTLSVVRSLLPPDDCHYWWADSMAVVKAVK